jgi:cytoskeletal protein CcmA (bactofilin family)
MSTIANSSRPPIPARAREPLVQRPLPKGIVAIAQTQQAQTEAASESAPQGTLIVGRDIQVKGQIDECQTLIVEGRVEASLRANRLEVRKGGIFVGAADVDLAEVAGTFDGTLRVAEELRIGANGRAQGDIYYGRLAIDAGGVIAGTVGTVEDLQGRDCSAESERLAETGS